MGRMLTAGTVPYIRFQGMFETNGTFGFFRIGFVGNQLHVQVSPISDSDVRTEHTAKDMNKLAGILLAIQFLEGSTISVVVSTNEAFLYNT